MTYTLTFLYNFYILLFTIHYINVESFRRIFVFLRSSLLSKWFGLVIPLLPLFLLSCLPVLYLSSSLPLELF